MTRHEKWFKSLMSGQFVFKNADLEWQIHFMLMNHFTDISQTAIVDNTMYSKLGLDRESETHKILLNNVLEYMVADNLIFPTDTGYKLTLHGYKVRQNGGYLKYLDKIDADRQLQTDSLNAAMKTNKNIRWNIWLTFTVATITGIAVGIQTYIAYKDRQDRFQKTGKQLSNPHCVRCNHLDRVLNREKTDTKHEKQTLTISP